MTPKKHTVVILFLVNAKYISLYIEISSIFSFTIHSNFHAFSRIICICVFPFLIFFGPFGMFFVVVYFVEYSIKTSFSFLLDVCTTFPLTACYLYVCFFVRLIVFIFVLCSIARSLSLCIYLSQCAL